MKNLKKFMTKNQKIFTCSLDGKEYPLRQKSTVRITTHDAMHRYNKGTGRPFIMNWKIVCCPKCFKKLKRNINKILLS